MLLAWLNQRAAENKSLLSLFPKPAFVWDSLIMSFSFFIKFLYKASGAWRAMLTRGEALISGDSLPSTPINSHLNPTLNTIRARRWEKTCSHRRKRFQIPNIRNCTKLSLFRFSMTLGVPPDFGHCFCFPALTSSSSLRLTRQSISLTSSSSS